MRVKPATIVTKFYIFFQAKTVVTCTGRTLIRILKLTEVLIMTAGSTIDKKQNKNDLANDEQEISTDV